MARKEMKYNLDEIIRKIQLGQQLTKDEEVYYLIEALGMKRREAERTVYLGEHHEDPGVLRD
jgi:hypothetical protein